MPVPTDVPSAVGAAFAAVGAAAAALGDALAGLFTALLRVTSRFLTLLLGNPGVTIAGFMIGAAAVLLVFAAAKALRAAQAHLQPQKTPRLALSDPKAKDDLQTVPLAGK